ncbi:TPA: hypothetical protein RUJ59_001401 [Listeria monocytogenes]|uniref:hypothetical protein n=1 Tax=Listeria seeligeri TaxID=1640 RepID=UPI001886ED07|nr:hypothetical protein [Listeria seeligeri]EJM7954261.1 hypothetical protein [Listeria monocytogenes]EJN2365831.1 hypothetical protein [Listeria monocytogenes]MBF2642855.1 hypothetical protein [Listeria seeligeri]HDZ6879246.1 hypothetical protein [Listeria monocytogenes]
MWQVNINFRSGKHISYPRIKSAYLDDEQVNIETFKMSQGQILSFYGNGIGMSFSTDDVEFIGFIKES